MSQGRWRRGLSGFLLAAAIACSSGAAFASVVHLCEDQDPADAAERDRQLRFAAVVREHLQASDAEVALVSRAGLALDRFGLRYSHAGLSLRRPTDPATPSWAVRQLYFDCHAARPRLFDQGLSAFVIGAGQPQSGWLSVLLLPAEAGRALARTAADDRAATALLHPQYSANAYAWGLDFQNCNQWVAELMARAWGADAAPPAGGDRATAQAWLREAGYRPTVFTVSPALLLAGAFVPWLNLRDHPSADVDALRLRVTMPEAIESFVRRRHPEARHIEFCHTPERIVVREGGPPLDPRCTPGAGDREIRFAAPSGS